MAVYVRPEPSFRRAYVQPMPRRWFARRLGLLAHLGLLLTAGFGAEWSWQALRRADGLRIDTITVEGNRRLSPGEVAGLVSPLQGENLLVADLQAGRASLLASGWIRGAMLRRVPALRVARDAGRARSRSDSVASGPACTSSMRRATSSTSTGPASPTSTCRS